ncbi:MAG: hypothetical protein DI535_23520 [Citrobacter freundii]|nr:MAG: hypothetical protein DI535_23520 [Citrobacter freundii]
MKKLIASLLLFSSLAVVVSSCSKDDPPLPPNTITFQAAEVGLDAAQNEATVTITLDRAESVEVPVTLTMTATGAIYGTDFTTTPAATGTEVKVVIPANSNTVSFKVTKASAALLSGGEKVKFTLASYGSLTLGATKEATVSFSSIVSTGTTAFIIPGKTTASNYANQVYVDFSNNAAVTADRKSWNLGFQSGSNFRVILNQAYQASAGATSKTDISAVTIADADALNLAFDPGAGSVSVVDNWTGDLTKTVFAEVSANAAENKVYLVVNESNRASKADWFKVKVTRNGDNYKVEYAKLSETTIKTIEVPKAAGYNFSFVSLENSKIVSVEPKAASWDIAWTYGTYDAGNGTPYWFQDFILLNYLGGAGAAEVIVPPAAGATVTTEAETIAKFDAFAEANLSGITWLTTRDAIGSKWRVTTGTGIKRDRFYLIKDPAGNIYKIRFVKMGVGDTGERGRPEIDFKLVKKA